jgi:enoyl-CoA hydratase
MDDFRAITVEVADTGVATIRMRPMNVLLNLRPWAEIQHEMGVCLTQLRIDDDIRIVIITGEEDGEFLVPPPSTQYKDGSQSGRLQDPSSEWGRLTGVIRAHQAVAEMEKPVIAKVNGDAMGFGQSLMFNSDMIIARSDAKICDMHLGLGETLPTGKSDPVGPQYSLIPGDGALSFVPLFLAPPKAKEYFFLAREYSASELAEMGLINYAVPLEELNAKVETIVHELLRRTRESIGFTKRVLNRRVVAELNSTVDAAIAYQMLHHRQHFDDVT